MAAAKHTNTKKNTSVDSTERELITTREEAINIPKHISVHGAHLKRSETNHAAPTLLKRGARLRRSDDQGNHERARAREIEEHLVHKNNTVGGWLLFMRHQRHNAPRPRKICHNTHHTSHIHKRENGHPLTLCSSAQRHSRHAKNTHTSWYSSAALVHDSLIFAPSKSTAPDTATLGTSQLGRESTPTRATVPSKRAVPPVSPDCSRIIIPVRRGGCLNVYHWTI